MITLRQAVSEVIRLQGYEILNDPNRFVGSVMDWIDTESVEANVLVGSCTEQYLGWFVHVRPGAKQGELDAAYRAAESYLHQEHGIDKAIAHKVSFAIARGIADISGAALQDPERISLNTMLVDENQRVGPSHTTHKAVQRSTTATARTTQGARRSKGPRIAGLVALVVLVCAGLTVAGLLLTHTIELPGPTGTTGADSGVVLSEPIVVSNDLKSTDDDEKVIFLTVRNSATSTVDLHASITFLDADGDVVDEKTCDAWSVGPGETTLLEQYSDVSAARKANYSVTATTPSYGKSSLLSCVTIDELTCNSNGLTVRVTNKSNKDVTLVSCAGYGYNEDDSEEFVFIPISYGGDERTLKPGEGRNVVFEGDGWSRFTRKVYVYGYAG